ncbi:hypothetical protein U1Q18_018547 [Sarracenia purpurea var. burkii]
MREGERMRAGDGVTGSRLGDDLLLPSDLNPNMIWGHPRPTSGVDDPNPVAWVLRESKAMTSRGIAEKERKETIEEEAGPSGPRLACLLYFVVAEFIYAAAINKEQDLRRKPIQQRRHRREDQLSKNPSKVAYNAGE